jgi:digeranylgeranylglycerophospholipid reductase
MVNSYDVVVIGGGPAGLNISWLLAKEGVSVCLIDSKEDITKATYNTLASFLDFRSYGFSNDVVASNISEIHFHSKHINFFKKGELFVIDKTNYFKELLKRNLEYGTKVISSTHIKEFSLKDNGEVESIIDNNGEIYKAKIFVDASGISGFFSRKLGLMDKNLDLGVGLEYNCEYLSKDNQLHLFMGTLYKNGYGWIFPLKNNRAIIGIGSNNLKVRSELEKRLNLMFEDEFIKKIVKKDNDNYMGGSIPITNIKTQFVYKNIICIGDSVSQVNPLLGEGQRFILESAFFASQAVKNALSLNDANLLHEYENLWKKKFHKQYWLCKKIQTLAVIFSKSNILCDIGALVLKTKSDKRFSEIIAGDI